MSPQRYGAEVFHHVSCSILNFFYLPLINAYELIDLGTMCSYELRSAFLAIFYIRIDCKDYQP